LKLVCAPRGARNAAIGQAFLQDSRAAGLRHGQRPAGVSLLHQEIHIALVKSHQTGKIRDLVIFFRQSSLAIFDRGDGGLELRFRFLGFAGFYVQFGEFFLCLQCGGRILGLGNNQRPVLLLGLSEVFPLFGDSSGVQPDVKLLPWRSDRFRQSLAFLVVRLGRVQLAHPDVGPGQIGQPLHTAQFIVYLSGQGQCPLGSIDGLRKVPLLQEDTAAVPKPKFPRPNVAQPSEAGFGFCKTRQCLFKVAELVVTGPEVSHRLRAESGSADTIGQSKRSFKPIDRFIAAKAAGQE